MSADTETLTIYGDRVADYAKMASEGAATPGYAEFVAVLPDAAHVLDLGCGPGSVSAAFQADGLHVDAMDASPQMIEHARQTYGLHACVARFDEIEGHNIYDGIWANFSLLHTAKADLPGILSALRHALRPGGVFHIGMKLGEGESRDSLGRFYAYYTEAELSGLLEAAGFTPFSSQTGTGEKGLSGSVSPWVVIRAHG